MQEGKNLTHRERDFFRVRFENLQSVTFQKRTVVHPVSFHIRRKLSQKLSIMGMTQNKLIQFIICVKHLMLSLSCGHLALGNCVTFIFKRRAFCSFGYGKSAHTHNNPRNTEEAEVERFYEDLQYLLELTPQKDVLFIVGDWNAKVGSQETSGVMGKFGLGVQNEAGQRLIEFCQENTLVITNTLFQQHKRRLYTSTSPRWSTLKSD